MKTSTLLAVALVGVAAYLVLRPRMAMAAPGTRPSTTSQTPGTSATSQLEAAAGAAGAGVIQGVGNAASDWFSNLFAERPPVESTSSYDQSLGLYNF